MNNDAELLQHLARLTRHAGELVLSYQGKQTETELKPGERFNPVTAADKAADTFLRQELLALTPSYGWLSEETKDSASRLKKKRVWVVDPLDGTKRFLDWHKSGLTRSQAVENRYQFAVSVALIENQRPLMSALYAPLRNELYVAMRDQGVQLNGRNIDMLDIPVSDLSDHTCIGSHTEHEQGLLDMLTPHVRVEPLGSAAYILAASGVQPLAVATSVKPKSTWDLAAGELIASELGQRVTDLAGAPIQYNLVDTCIAGYISAPAHVYDELKRLLPNAPIGKYE